MTGAGQVEIVHRESVGCLIAKLHGRLDSLSYRPLRDELIKLAVEQPRAVIVDVDHLEIQSETVLTVFSSAWSRVQVWPEVPILLVARDSVPRRSLGRTAIARAVPVFGSLREAIASIPAPPARKRRSAGYPPVFESSALAREFVGRTCADWDLTSWTQDVLSVASELVENAVKHAQTALRLRLEYRAGLFAVAVRDADPRMAVIRQTATGRPDGYGLQIVAGLARAWGCSPDLRGGKVVWAVLSARSDWFQKYPAWSPPFQDR
ncbi:MAG TPA: STAS domain-containing protein [Amycolatopsis sp.]|nr:STAS domain-containing protein [Amycolatopsis sp.]